MPFLTTVPTCISLKTDRQAATGYQNISLHLFLCGRLVSSETGELSERGDEERELRGREGGEEGGREIGGQTTKNTGQPIDLLLC